MTESEWLVAADPEQMLPLVLPRASDRKLRYFGCACCRSVFPAVKYDGSRSLVAMIEDFADGLVSAEALEEARQMHARRCYDPLPDGVYLNAADDAAIQAAYPGSSFPIGYAAARAAGAGRDRQARPARVEYHRQISEAIREQSFPAGRTEIDKFLATCQLLNDQMVEVESAFLAQEHRTQASYLRDIFGDPFRPVAADPDWLTSTVTALARSIYESRDFTSLPILADALQDAGCENSDILSHGRSGGVHVRGCWVVDLVLGKQ